MTLSCRETLIAVAPAKDVCLLDEVSHGRVVLQVAAAKEEPRVEAFDGCVATMPFGKVHLCRACAQGCQHDKRQASVVTLFTLGTTRID